MASSYKFCVIASGEYDIYAARERANEWDYARVMQLLKMQER